MNICPRCQHHFAYWVEYQEHMNLTHCTNAPRIIQAVESFEDAMLNPETIKPRAIQWTPPKDARGNPIYKQMDPQKKRQIVKRVEERLSRHIIGG